MTVLAMNCHIYKCKMQTTKMCHNVTSLLTIFEEINMTTNLYTRVGYKVVATLL